MIRVSIARSHDAPGRTQRVVNGAISPAIRHTKPVRLEDPFARDRSPVAAGRRPEESIARKNWTARAVEPGLAAAARKAASAEISNKSPLDAHFRPAAVPRPRHRRYPPVRGSNAIPQRCDRWPRTTPLRSRAYRRWRRRHRLPVSKDIDRSLTIRRRPGRARRSRRERRVRAAAALW